MQQKRRTKIACAEAIDNIREISGVGRTNSPICTDQEQEELLNNILSEMPDTLTGHQMKQFGTLITSFAHIFALKPDELGRTNILKHRIETSGNPIQQGVRRLPLPKRDEVKKLLNEMQEKEIITPSKH